MIEKNLVRRDEQRRLEEALELMPREVRDKLDRAGIKLHLAEWKQFTLSERADLRDRPCATEDEAASYRAALTALVRERCGKDPDGLLREVRAAKRQPVR